MYKNILVFISFIAIMAPAVSIAETSPFYIGINAARFDSTHDSFEPDGGMVHLGWDMNNYFALEVSGGFSDKYENESTGDTKKVDFATSAFARFNMRFNRITLYVLGGYSQAKTTSTINGTNITEESNGGSYGYGIDFYGTRDLALSIRRVEFIDIDKPAEKVQLGATMLGITYYYDKPRLRSRY